MNIISAIENQSNVSVTENGALGFRTSGTKLLDINFAVSSLRNKSDDEVIKQFSEVFAENPELAIKWLFFARDVRQGLGEKRLFKLCFQWFLRSGAYKTKDLITQIPEYGSWKDIFDLLLKTKDPEIEKFVIEQIVSDFASVKPSLCLKWAPSVNCSNKERKHLARYLADKIGMTESNYRKKLAYFRKMLNVVEVPMSSNEWDNIKYETVPSKANLRYGKAFLRHDKERRSEFLEQVITGEKKLHAGVLYPHDIVHLLEYECGGWRDYSIKNNADAEAAWKSYPKKHISNVLVVADGSGSMTSQVAPNVTALDVANSLAIYFAECNTGIFKDKYITFSDRPQLVDLTVPKDCTNPLARKLEIALKHSEVSSTNIEAVFKLILEAAVNHKLPQEELPRTVLAISDMEFNSAVQDPGNQDKLFNIISKMYNKEGYSLPRLVFWNVDSRTGTIPVVENENGVALVSGYSVNNTQMILDNEVDPWKCLVKVLKGSRYEAIKLEKK